MAHGTINVTIISHPSGVKEYQDKIRELAKFRDLAVTLIVPQVYREGALLIDAFEGDSTYRVIKLPAIFGKRGSQNGHFYLHLASTLRRTEPDVLFIDEEPESIVTAQSIFLGRRLRHRPKILMLSSRNQEMDFEKHWGIFTVQRYLYPVLSRYTLKRVDWMDMCNHEGERIFRAWGYQRPVTVIPQIGIDPEMYCPGPPKKEILDSLCPSGLVIGYVGRLLHMKGIATLINAVAEIKSEFTLLLVGWGPQREYFETLAREKGIEDRLRITGAIPFQDVVQYLRCMDMMVLPSLTTKEWKEQFGRVLPEAMACEVPVIGSSSGEIPAVIGDAGLVFQEGNIDELRSCIESLISDPEHRRSLGVAGRKRVLENFTGSRLAAKLHDVFLEMTAS